MRYLSGAEEQEAIGYLNQAVEAALNSTCRRSCCGSVIIKDGKVIGSGFNSPPYNLESQRRCSVSKKDYHRKITDKTCCIHAEQRAIFDALRNNPHELPRSTLYFIRLDEHGNKLLAGRPYCTICSKMALDVEIAEFVLWHSEGICLYNTNEYNYLSFQFRE